MRGRMRGRGRGRGRPPLSKASATPESSRVVREDGTEERSGKDRKSQKQQEREIREQMMDESYIDEVNPNDESESEISTNSLESKELMEDLDHGGTEKGVVDVIEKEEPVKRKLWVDVIRGNRVPRRDAMMDYEPPHMVDGEPEIEIGEEDIESEVEFWKAGLILFAVGKEMSMNGMKQFMAKVWNTVSLPDLYYHDDGYFIARFSSVEDRDMILQNGPYTIFNVPLFIRKWSPEFVMKDDLLRVMPVWVTFPSLPLHLWGKRSLSKIASAIGKPIVADDCTNKKLRVSYARVLIEIDVTQQRKNCISIKDTDGRHFSQVVKYEWTPLFCQECQVIGHKCDRQKKEKEKGGKQEWKAKKNDRITQVASNDSMISKVMKQGDDKACSMGVKEPCEKEDSGISGSPVGSGEIMRKTGREVDGSPKTGIGLRKTRDKVP